jgi:DNA-binding NarL/FixJ family response regulator
MMRGIDRTIGLIPERPNSHAHAARTAPARLMIVSRHELTAAGIEALLRAGGHRVLFRFTRGDDLLRSLKSNRPDILLLNMIRREAVGLISQLRGDHRSISIILMLEERDMITAASLLQL